jgi:hypothetical protein
MKIDEIAQYNIEHGIYRFNCANPFVSGLTEKDWNGQGYLIKQPYRDGAEISYADPAWVHNQPDESVPRPHEYRHTLSTLVNGLIEQGFVIRHLSDSTDFSPDLNATPGT